MVITACMSTKANTMSYSAKLGYMPVTVADTFALQGVVTPINVGMWDNNYAPAFVTACPGQ